VNSQELTRQAKRIMEDAKSNQAVATLVEAREFLRVYTGDRSSFLKSLDEVKQFWSGDQILQFVKSTLTGFIRYVENGLHDGISVERQAQIDVVSDFLGQAQALLDNNNVHPAAPTVLIGASLEEFLRNWLEERGTSLGGKKPSLDAYAKTLREADLITKQDLKDITSWAGLRNHAAHGEWDEVNDKRRVSLMLEGVNLFMRKYTS
jgi:hypothetical protein